MPLPLSGAESVEEILLCWRQAASWLAERGLICIQCGETFWGSLRDLAAYRHVTAEQLDVLLAELNAFLADADAAVD